MLCDLSHFARIIQAVSGSQMSAHALPHGGPDSNRFNFLLRNGLMEEVFFIIMKPCTVSNLAAESTSS